MRHLLLFVVLLLASKTLFSQAILTISTNPSPPTQGELFSSTYLITGAKNNEVYTVTGTCPSCTPSSWTCSFTTSTSGIGSCTYTNIMAPSSPTTVISYDASVVGGTGAVSAGACNPCMAFNPANNLPLPVELTAFYLSTEQNKVVLSWQTASEYNNDYFEVEHSQDGKDFAAIGRVTGNGNRGEFSAYSFTHEQAQTGIHYYRLKQVDLDGTFEYSKVISTRLGDHKMVRVFPNPTQNTLKITGLSPEDEVEAITVTDIHGKQVLTMSSLEDGLLDLSGEAAGMYIVTIRYNGKVVADRIIKE